MAASGAGDLHRGGQATDRDAGRLPATLMLSAPAVPLTMMVSAAPSPVPPVSGRLRFTCGDAGAGQVVDGDGVGAAEGVEVDLLDAVDVHGDVADVAEEPEALAVGGEVDAARWRWSR